MFTDEELDEAQKKGLEHKRVSGKPEICTCGHPTRKHHLNEIRGYMECWALQSTCDCREVIPIARVKNARVFMYKTEPTVAQAFVRGIAALKERGLAEEVEYLLARKCMMPTNDEGTEICGSTERVKLVQKSRHNGHMTVFLCEEHQ